MATTTFSNWESLYGHLAACVLVLDTSNSGNAGSALAILYAFARYRVQLSALVVSPRILVANVTMLLNSESGVDRNIIYFVDNKL